MNARGFVPISLLLLVAAAILMQASERTKTVPTAEQGATELRVAEAYGKLPLSFEANRGQTDRRVKFLSRGSGYNLFLTPTEAVLTLQNPKSEIQKSQIAANPPSLSGRSAPHPRFSSTSVTPSEVEGSASSLSPTVLRMQLIGANPRPEVLGLEELPGKSHYFIGNDPKKWHTNIPHYARVRYEEVYPGVDLVYYGTPRQLEYDFVVASGADPSAITLGFQGANRLEIDAQGDLMVHSGMGGQLRQRRPLIYQEVNRVRREIRGDYVLRGKHEVGFQVGHYDASRPLIIDPVLLVSSTFLGGSDFDSGRGIAVDPRGNAYVMGETRSVGFPTTAGAFDTSFNSEFDAFVIKLNPAGSELVYSTFLGGSFNDVEDFGLDIAVDPRGNAYVTGLTNSADFSTTPGAFATFLNGDYDVFVTKLNPAGSKLRYSTFLGGNAFEQGFGIALDSQGNAYVSGFTCSTDFPTTAGAFDTSLNGNCDPFVTKLNPAGSNLRYSTFLGGNAFDEGGRIAVDSQGNAYVSGFTCSTDFPTTAGAFDTSFNGICDAFVTKLNSTGSKLRYSTFLGGSAFEAGWGIAVDFRGNAYVTGVTDPTDFPTTAGAFDTSHNGGFQDAFVSKLR